MPYTEKQRGFMASALARKMRGESRPTDPDMTVADLKTYVSSKLETPKVSKIKKRLGR